MVEVGYTQASKTFKDAGLLMWNVCSSVPASIQQTEERARAVWLMSCRHIGSDRIRAYRRLLTVQQQQKWEDISISPNWSLEGCEILNLTVFKEDFVVQEQCFEKWGVIHLFRPHGWGGGAQVDAGRSQAPCGRPHRKLELTDVILSSCHAKKFASFFKPEFRLWTE